MADDNWEAGLRGWAIAGGCEREWKDTLSVTNKQPPPQRTLRRQEHLLRKFARLAGANNATTFALYPRKRIYYNLYSDVTALRTFANSLCFEKNFFRGFVFNAFRNVFQKPRIFKLVGESNRVAE